MPLRRLKGLSIEWKFPLVVCGLLIITIAVLSVAAFVEVSQSVEHAAEQRLHGVVGQMVDLMSAQAKQTERRAERIGALPEMHSLLHEVLDSGHLVQSARIPEPLSSDSTLVAMELWDAAGRRALVAGSGQSTIATLGSEDLFAAVARSDSGAVGRFQAIGDTVVIPSVAPIIEEGQVLGHVVLWHRVVGRAEARDQIGRLIGLGGVLYVGSVPGAWTDQATMVPPPPVDVAHRQGTLRYARPGAGSRIAEAAPVPGTPWLVLLEFPRQTVMAPAQHFLQNFAIISLAVLAFGLAIAWVFSRRVTRPLTELTLAADAIVDGDHRSRVVSRSHDELGRLATAFNQMLDRVDGEVAARAASEEQWRLLFEYNPHPMWVYDRETLGLLRVNEATVKQYGFSREELARMTLPDLRAEADRPELDAVLRSLGTDTEEVHLVRHRRKDGSMLFVEARGRPLAMPDRKARLVAATDVTERVAAEQGIHEAEARARATSEMLQSLIDVAPQAIIAVDLDQKVTRWNRAAEGLFGWAEAEVLGQPAPCLAAIEAVETLRLAHTGPQGRPEPPFELGCLRKDGSPVKVLFAAAALRDAFGEMLGTITVLTDLTERAQLEEQLRQSQKMEAIGRLAGGVAHDFNNLLMVITAYSTMLLEGNLSEDDHRSAQEIADAAVRAAALTRQLLLFSRKQVVQHQRIDIAQGIRAMQPMLSRLLFSNIEMVTNFDPEPTAIIADMTQIEQVVMNLAVNASDAMPDGGTLTLEVVPVDLDHSYSQTHVEVKPGRYIMLAVSDTGVGMDQATLSKIFEPFFTTKPVGHGTGLGLATVYAIVKELGGHIWVYSEIGRGATFKIYLPEASPDRDAAAPAAGATDTPASHSIGTETVLLVEDDEAVRRATRSMLERAKYSVLEAADGVAGLAVAEKHRGAIDVVVTDLMMPGMDGRAFAGLLRQTHPGVRVIFISGYTDDAVTRRGLVDPSQAFLQKPFTARDLTALIRSALDRPA
jgi:PAS domain S-box-containing protein